MKKRENVPLGKKNREFEENDVEISRELAADRNEYLEMDNLAKHTQKVKKTGK